MRISVGLEDVDDLLEDINYAMQKGQLLYLGSAV
ncbi:MAG: hypothetical protein QXW48_00615 [Thermoplasmata archaeon]